MTFGEIIEDNGCEGWWLGIQSFLSDQSRPSWSQKSVAPLNNIFFHYPGKRIKGYHQFKWRSFQASFTAEVAYPWAFSKGTTNWLDLASDSCSCTAASASLVGVGSLSQAWAQVTQSSHQWLWSVDKTTNVLADGDNFSPITSISKSH